MMEVDGLAAPATPPSSAAAAPAAAIPPFAPAGAYTAPGGPSRRSSKRPRDSLPTFHPGDRVDAMDLEGVWHEAVVKEVDAVQVRGCECVGVCVWKARVRTCVCVSFDVRSAPVRVSGFGLTGPTHTHYDRGTACTSSGGRAGVTSGLRPRSASSRRTPRWVGV